MNKNYNGTENQDIKAKRNFELGNKLLEFFVGTQILRAGDGYGENYLAGLAISQLSLIFLIYLIYLIFLIYFIYLIFLIYIIYFIYLIYIIYIIYFIYLI